MARKERPPVNDAGATDDDRFIIFILRSLQAVLTHFAASA
jgi:hypothetical protein